jgi:NAD(P)-dependent dehydrogenase (short-subunit alcohol dehydrogenase family)
MRMLDMMETAGRRLAGKVALITGSGQGIGRSAALLFAGQGAVVVVADADGEKGRATARAIEDAGGKAHCVTADVSKGEDVEALMEAVRRECGCLNVLYNNASIYLPGEDGRIVDIRETVWDRIVAVNLKSIYLCCRFGIPLMELAGGGAIINTASSAGVVGIPNCDAYTATKGATISLTRSLAVEYGPKNIRVNCIVPAAVQTEMLGASSLKDETFDEERFLGLRTPLRRYGKPEEIAELAVFLASDEASYINGSVITADGGITINGDLSKLG